MGVTQEDVNFVLQHAVAAKLELAKRAIREGGDGAPDAVREFIRLQWGDVLNVPPEEQESFGGDLRLDDFQVGNIQAAFNPAVTEIAIKGCTKPGKGYSVALIANMWFDIFSELRGTTRIEPRVIIMSASVSHAKEVMFAEIVAVRKQMKHPGPGEILTEKIVDGTKHTVVIRNPTTGEGFSGQHSERTLFIFDEATSTDDTYYLDAKKQARLIIAVANPRTLSGWFREMYEPAAAAGRDENETQLVPTKYGQRYLVTVGGEDCKNVREKRLERPYAPENGYTINVEGLPEKVFRQGDPIPPKYFDHVRLAIPGQLDYARYLDITSNADPHHVNVFGRGRFPEEDAEKQVILHSWFGRHHDHHAELTDNGSIAVEALGLDIAASGEGDATVLTYGGSQGIRGQLSVHLRSTMDVVKWVLTKTKNQFGIDLCLGRVPIGVDMDGIGKGVGDRLVQQGVAVIRINGNMRSDTDPARYGNLRTECYAELGRRLNPNEAWGQTPFAIPRDAFLVADLCAPEKMGDDVIKFNLIPKRKPARGGPNIYDKLGRSPDKGDSAVYFFKALRVLGLVVDTTGRSLVHTVGIDAEDDDEPTFEEQRQMDIDRLIARMDAKAETPAGLETGWVRDGSPLPF